MARKRPVAPAKPESKLSVPEETTWRFVRLRDRPTGMTWGLRRKTHDVTETSWFRARAEAARVLGAEPTTLTYERIQPTTKGTP